MKRNLWKYLPKKENYAKLFDNPADKARMAYNRDMDFRKFVLEWDKDNPELLGWTLVDFHAVYTSKQLSLF